MSVKLHGWGRIAMAEAVALQPRDSTSATLPASAYLPVGNSRSYGDSAMPAGTAILTRGMNRILDFNADTGILRAEAGVLLSEIIAYVVPHGWFLPVTPGTQFVTLGGALANDVHGKNHHRAGSFGCHVTAFELIRSDGTRLLCSPQSHADFYAATIGGMGLTGLVTWVEMALKRTPTPDVIEETLRFPSLGRFFTLSTQSDATHEYSVAWIDSSARGTTLGRGLFMRANHANAPMARRQGLHLTLPFTPPVSLMNGASIGLFNAAQFALAKAGERRRDYAQFFYPLDGIGGWNRAYGPRGFHQHQSVLPLHSAEQAVADMLAALHAARIHSFISVLKIFGPRASPGLLSFAREGATLALDLPNHGEATLHLLSQLDQIALRAGGAVNPYKDSRMPREVFEASFPALAQMQPWFDPLAASQFSRRIGLPQRLNPTTLAAE
ncbi:MULTISPECIES: FAD-binding oxidoreductase [unclassified Beijerinckia]|uniref:FAD-binding oxidoreductase n=1 Tax=unclassified Beijerinckia TaxID=2638183 RepID=UPI000B81BFB7|nr:MULTISPECIES: FAD-binding oxidoreductase [unclassified Beijerinckia]MDH7797264.1 FAD/FMN-containing dehydrogenase [Beijerinckia sp. GAS462]